MATTADMRTLERQLAEANTFTLSALRRETPDARWQRWRSVQTGASWQQAADEFWAEMGGVGNWQNVLLTMVAQGDVADVSKPVFGDEPQVAGKYAKLLKQWDAELRREPSLGQDFTVTAGWRSPGIEWYLRDLEHVMALNTDHAELLVRSDGRQDYLVSGVLEGHVFPLDSGQLDTHCTPSGGWPYHAPVPYNPPRPRGRGWRGWFGH